MTDPSPLRSSRLLVVIALLVGLASGVGIALLLSGGDGATSLLAEFGPEVFAWARIVPVQAATPLQVVLGPVGEAWQVVGVLPRL